MVPGAFCLKCYKRYNIYYSKLTSTLSVLHANLNKRRNRFSPITNCFTPANRRLGSSAENTKTTLFFYIWFISQLSELGSAFQDNAIRGVRREGQSPWHETAATYLYHFQTQSDSIVTKFPSQTLPQRNHLVIEGNAMYSTHGGITPKFVHTSTLSDLRALFDTR